MNGIARMFLSNKQEAVINPTVLFDQQSAIKANRLPDLDHDFYWRLCLEVGSELSARSQSRELMELFS